MDAMMLVGTNSGLWLAGPGEDARRLDKTPLYGVTWDDRGNVYLGSRGSGGCVLMCSPSLKGRIVIKELVRDVHQVLWAGGTLYWANTHEDTLEAWDGAAVKVVHEASDSGKDHNHLNSVWADGDGALWVVEHGRDDDESRIRCLETGWRFNIPGTTDLHNVYTEGHWAYALSGKRALAVDWALLRVTELASVPESYLRGLARGDGFWAVGRSVVGARHEREGRDAHVLLYDDDWQFMERLTLPGAGQVYEVRLLEGDRAHNGLPYPGELP